MLSSCFPSFFTRDQSKAYEKLARKQKDTRSDEKENIRQMLMRQSSGKTLPASVVALSSGAAAKRPFADITNTEAAAAASSEDGAQPATKKTKTLALARTSVMSPPATKLSADEAKMVRRKKVAAKKALAAFKAKSMRQLQKAIKKDSKTITISSDDDDDDDEDDSSSDAESDDNDNDDEADDTEASRMEEDIKKEKADVMVVAADHTASVRLRDISKADEEEDDEDEDENEADEDETEEGVQCESDEEDEIGVEVDDIDEEDANEPENCAAYVREIYEHLHRRQLVNRPASDYLQNRQEGELTEKMRALTVNWMVEAAERCNLLTETLFLAVDLFDRFLSLRKVSQKRVQLIAITCLFVASKYEEIYYPTLKDFVWLSNDTVSGSDIVKAESIVLAALGFDLATINPFHFIRRFSKASHSSRRTHELTKYIMELSLSSYATLGHKPSVVAAACVYIARAMTRQSPVWTPTLVHFTRCAAPSGCSDADRSDSTFDEDDSDYDDSGRNRDKGLIECVRAINELLLVAEDHPTDPRIVAVRKKYAGIKHHSVALVPTVEL